MTSTILLIALYTSPYWGVVLIYFLREAILNKIYKGDTVYYCDNILARHADEYSYNEIIDLKKRARARLNNMDMSHCRKRFYTWRTANPLVPTNDKSHSGIKPEGLAGYIIHNLLNGDRDDDWVPSPWFYVEKRSLLSRVYYAYFQC